MALTTTTLLNGLKSLFGASSSAPASNSRIPYCNSSNEVTGSTSLTDLASVLGANLYKQVYNSGTTSQAKCRITISQTSGPFCMEILVADNWPYNYRKYAFTARNDYTHCDLIYGTETTGQSHSLNGFSLDITTVEHSYVFVHVLTSRATYTVTDVSSS